MGTMRAACVLATFVAAVPAHGQQHALTVPRDIRQLTERAAHIVRGHVSGVRMERDPALGVATLVVTLHVRETFKGAHQEVFSFRQYLWDVRDRVDHAGYRKGDQLLLLLIAPSQYGLSSPVGMEQGRFRIVRDERGQELAVNGHGNSRLLDGVDSSLAKDGIPISAVSARFLQRQRAGPVDAAGLADLIRELVHAQR